MHVDTLHPNRVVKASDGEPPRVAPIEHAGIDVVGDDRTRTIPGVSLSVGAAMLAVHADVVCEDNLLMRTCGHGIRHPVGHLGSRLPFTSQRHERGTATGLAARADCCGCCAQWAMQERGPEAA